MKKLRDVLHRRWLEAAARDTHDDGLQMMLDDDATDGDCSDSIVSLAKLFDAAIDMGLEPDHEEQLITLGINQMATWYYG